MTTFARLLADFQAQFAPKQPSPALQTACDDLDALNEQAERMLADLPKPFDGKDRRTV